SATRLRQRQAETLRVTLPALRQEVHTLTRLGVPPTIARTRWMFGFQRRLVRMWECETLCPKPGPLPQTSQLAATVSPECRARLCRTTARRDDGLDGRGTPGRLGASNASRPTRQLRQSTRWRAGPSNRTGRVVRHTGVVGRGGGPVDARTRAAAALGTVGPVRAPGRSRAISRRAERDRGRQRQGGRP